MIVTNLEMKKSIRRYLSVRYNNLMSVVRIFCLELHELNINIFALVRSTEGLKPDWREIRLILELACEEICFAVDEHFAND